MGDITYAQDIQKRSGIDDTKFIKCDTLGADSADRVAIHRKAGIFCCSGRYFDLRRNGYYRRVHRPQIQYGVRPRKDFGSRGRQIDSGYGDPLLDGEISLDAWIDRSLCGQGNHYGCARVYGNSKERCC